VKAFDLYTAHPHATKRSTPPKFYHAAGLCEGYAMIDGRDSPRNKASRSLLMTSR